MTTTTVKRPKAERNRAARYAALPRHLHVGHLRLAPLPLAAMFLASPCHADWRVNPTLSTTATYTDNVALQADDQAQGQFVTELTPGLVLIGSGTRYQVSASGQWRHFLYNNEKLPNTVEHQLQYAVSGQGEMLKDFLFLEASAAEAPQSISAFGPRSGDTPYSNNNRAKIKTWRISPYLAHRFGAAAQMVLRYQRDSVESGDFDLFGSSVGDTFSASVNSGPSFRSMNWGLNFTRQILKNELAGPSSTTNIASNWRYILTRRFALTATAGYDRYDFQSLGGRTAGRNWSGGFDWQPSLRTNLKASIGRHYFGKTGSLDASVRSRRSVWSITYGDGVTTTRQQFLLPAAIDTAAMLDDLFKATIPDEALRQQAVAAYIRNTGLPSSLANDINYLSNRFIRQKQLLASAALSGSRSSGVFSLYRTERIALSTQQSDSPLLGPQLLSLNDNVRQIGASLTYGYRITPRSNVNATASAGRSESLSTGFEDNNRMVRLGLTRDIGRNVRTSMELRHVRGSAGINAGTYHENAISATLSAQF